MATCDWCGSETEHPYDFNGKKLCEVCSPQDLKPRCPTCGEFMDDVNGKPLCTVCCTDQQMDDALRAAGGDPEAIGQRGQELVNKLLKKREQNDE
jgi:hypothetical protein